MSLSVSYSVGGVIDEIKKLNFPAHVFPTLMDPSMKGLKIEVPARTGEFTVSFTAPYDIELTDVAMACSGYGPDDYWELEIGGSKKFETIYCKELPQHVNMGTAIFTVFKVTAGTEIKFIFNNASATSKVAWFDIRFLK